MPALLSAPSRGRDAAAPPRSHLLALYTQHAQTARILASRLVCDGSEADDIVQEVFLNLLLRPDRFDPDRGTGRAWLLTVVRNRSLDHLRRRCVHPQEDVSVLADRLPDRQTPDVQEQVAAAAWSELLWRLVDALPPCQAELIRRAFVGGQTHQEIAADTGLPLGTVKGRIRLGLGKLRCAMRNGALTRW